jgi:acyl-homoserine lactone acylase PvdQ
MVRLGLHLRDTHQGGLSEAATNALVVLERWFKAGASSDLKSDGAALATRISMFFRFVATPVTHKFGGGESGLARFLKDASSRIAADSKAKFSEDECRFIDTVLANAWAEQRGDGSRVVPGQRARGAAQPSTLGWFDSLDGFGSLDAAEDLAQPALTCIDGQTIHSQAAQSYTQWVPLHDVDSAQTICPIGHSDRPDSRFRKSTVSLWAGAKLHPAPLSRAAVERITTERLTLGR